MRLAYEELKNALSAVDDRVGWDFSSAHEARDPVPWEYGELVSKYLRETDVVLDIGTGGGERFLKLAPFLGRGLGVDVDPDMIAQARRNQAAVPADHVTFEVMDAFHLAAEDASFDVVLNCHCDVAVDEVVRVLRPGGFFITQQVASRNTEDLLEAFGWTFASFGEGWWQPVAVLATAFENAGCHVDARAEYDVRYWFLDVASLLFWLKAVPLPEPFDLDRHWHGVNHILDRYVSDRGIETNEHRELLIVRKL
ncbi:MAG: class I SAM-dependent methyltransferase [Anaerolineae bacterium]|nr:class I SAM-dependent methyltransferase [Anaerolineae bacterium]